MIVFDSPEAQTEFFTQAAEAARRAWDAIQRIVTEALAAIARWVKRNQHNVRSVYRSMGYRPKTIMSRKLRRL